MRLIGLLLVFASLGLVLRGASTASVAPPAGNPTRPVGEMLGIYPKPRAGRTHYQELRYLEREIGRRFVLDHDYIHFDSPFPSKSNLESVATGHTLVVNVRSKIRHGELSWAAIASGKYDSYLRAKARAFRALRTPVVVVFDHEPEDNTAKGTPAEYVAAWRHFVGIFRKRGATNVSFDWCLRASTFAAGNADAYYPGDKYVDYVSADGYNWAFAGANGAAWRSLGVIFQPFVDWATENHPAKPQMITETGVVEDPADSTRKAAWFDDALSQLKAWPTVVAFVYFNLNADGEWPFDSSLASLAAYKALAKD